MNPLRVSALFATVAFVATPALARTISPGQPTAKDARQLQVVARFADELAAGSTAADAERFKLLDKIDIAWNSVSTVYIPLDTRATFPGGQAEPFTVMQARMSVLNSTVPEDHGFPASAEAVAAWARHLLQKTSGKR
jgi:hypothetical protein